MILDPATAALATPQEIARAYRRQVGYIYKLASVQKWRRIKHDGRVYYRLSDADQVLGKDPDPR